MSRHAASPRCEIDDVESTLPTGTQTPIIVTGKKKDRSDRELRIGGDEYAKAH
jgi:hypothetical protein